MHKTLELDREYINEVKEKGKNLIALLQFVDDIDTLIANNDIDALQFGLQMVEFLYANKENCYVLHRQTLLAGVVVGKGGFDRTHPHFIGKKSIDELKGQLCVYKQPSHVCECHEAMTDSEKLQEVLNLIMENIENH